MKNNVTNSRIYLAMKYIQMKSNPIPSDMFTYYEGIIYKKERDNDKFMHGMKQVRKIAYFCNTSNNDYDVVLEDIGVRIKVEDIYIDIISDTIHYTYPKQNHLFIMDRFEKLLTKKQIKDISIYLNQRIEWEKS